MEAPSSEEISSRLERATRSALASCSFRLPSSPSPPSPLLSDLLANSAPPDSLRCSHCQAPLLRGPRSLFCFACGAPLQTSSPPKISFRSSLAHRRLLDSLKIEGLETNSKEPGDESSVLDLDSSSHWNLGSIQEQESVSCKSESSSFSIPGMENISNRFKSGQYDVPSSTSMDTAVSILERSAEVNIPESVHSTKQESILDYSSKLEGISLEDFFSTQTTSQSAVGLNPSTVVGESLPGITEGLKTQNGHKEYFWDSLIEYNIPDSDNTTSKAFDISKESLWSIKEHGEPKTGSFDDDESWESDFQSATPVNEISLAESLKIGHFNTPSMQPADMNNWFVSSNVDKETDFPVYGAHSGLPALLESSPKETSGSIIGENDGVFVPHDGKPGPVNLFSTERHPKADTERQMDNLLFGSSWQQSGTEPSMKNGIKDFAGRTSVGESFINSVTHQKGEDLSQVSLPNQPGLTSLEEVKATMLDNGSHHEGKGPLKTLDAVFGKEHEMTLSEKANETLDSLLAQLHDLSFMLANKLVIKTGNGRNLKHQLDLQDQKFLF